MSTARRVFGATAEDPRRARDAVAWEMPAAVAICCRETPDSSYWDTLTS